MRPDILPPGLLGQQYTRAAMYLSHQAFIRGRLRERHPSPRVVEFGGSNGYIRSLFGPCDYEVAPNVPVVDVQDLGAYPEQHYDVVVLDEILEHVERPWVAVDQIHRILRPGGCLLTSSPFMIAEHKVPMDYWRFTKDGLRVLLRSFSDVEVHSWGNPQSVTYIMNGMMVTSQQAIQDGAFDLTDVEKFAISVWAYAWK
jgi:SAM-dependent methyltransferase